MENRVHSAIAAKKNLNLFNRSFGAVGSPYQTNETQSRQRRKLTLACHLRAIFLLFAFLTLGVGQMWGADTYAIAGSFNSWSTTANQRSGTGTISITISSTGNYTFKIVKNGTWCGNSGTMTRDNCSNWGFTYNGGNNCTISVDKTGTYTFNITNGTPTLSVTYPDATWSVAGGMNSWSTTANTFSSSKTSVSLTNGTTYEFKIYRKEGNVYYGNSGTMTSANCSNWDFSSSAGNAKITANITGTYVFELVNQTPRITVHYPVAISYNKGTYGTGTISGGAKTWGENYTLSSSTFTRTGYTQDGWATSDGGDKAYNLGGTYSTHTAQTFYPHWVENMSTVSFVASPTGKGTFTVGGSTVTSTTAGATTTRAVTAVPGTGYNFGSWAISGGATISSTSTNPTTVTGKGAGADATLTCTFSPKQCTITFDKNGGTGGDNGTTGTYDAAMPTITPPTRDHYTFAGYWDAETNNNGSGTQYYNADGTSTRNWNKNTTSATTLYAKWTEITHDVRVGTNTHATTSPNSWTAFGEVTGGTVSATSISTGYRFNGWSSDKGGTFADASSASTTFYPTTNDTYVTASIVAKTYSITLNKNGGDSDGSATATYASSTIGGFSAASRAGYSTDGYYTDPSAGVKILNSDGTLVTYSASVSSYVNTSDQWKYDDNITLYPHWTENATYYTLHYTYGTGLSSYFSSISATKTSGGDAVADNASLVSGTGVTLTATPADHYRFVGWYSAAGCTANTLVSTNNPYGFSMSANTNLYAKAELMTTAITLDANGGAGGTTSVTATHGSRDLSSSINKPTRSGYTLSGWYTEESGGTRILLKGGTTTSSVSGYLDGSGNWIYTGSTLTLYAHWTANNYKVTFDKQSGAGGNDNVTATYNAAMPSATMPTRTGYDFQGYYGSTGGSGTKYYNSDGSNAHVWDQAAARTIYAYWTAHNYSITYSPASAPTGCTYTTKPTSADYNTTVDMVITPASGYTISVSAVDASSSPVTVTPGASNHYTFTQPASAVTVTVTATERKSTVTVTTATSSQGTLKFGSTGKDWGTTTSVGVATTQNITATAAAGFTFVRWDLSGAAATASSTTSATITLKADGSGDTGTATAVFAEDLSSPWIVAGGNKIVSGDTWRTTADANNSMVKKTGHSTESIVYFTVPITTVCSGENNGNYQFKIYNTSTSKWYGLEADGSSYYLLKAEDGTQKSLIEGYKNIELRAYVTGDYVFRLDYSTSTPKLTVTWPVFNQVRISNASPSDATNVGNFDMSDPVSNVRSVKRTLNANTTYTFKIMYDSDWFGYNSGTFTRSTSTSSNQRTIGTSGGDMTLTTDYAGDYTFKFNQSTKALSVDFPTAYKITFGKGSVDGTTGSFSAVDLDNGSSAVTSNSTWVKSGDKVKITAPSAKSGYRFLGWYDNNSATGDAITTLANCTITVNTTKTVYACYAENLTAITITTDGHGTITTPSPVSNPYSLGVTTGQTINASANTGYHWNTWTVSGTAALGTTATTASNTAKGNGTNGSTGTVTATFSPNTYSVKFNGNGSTSGSMSNQAFTYDVAQALTSNAFVKTGYNFAGWATAADGDVTYSNGQSVSNLTSTNGATYNLHAKWTPKQSALTFDYQTGDAGYKSSGTITVTSSATYDATMPALSGNVPTAKDGYAFIGFFDGTDSGAKKYYNADKSSAATWDKDTESSTTFYAHYKKAEITELTFVSGTVAPNEVNGVKVTPVVDPALGSIGTVHIDWQVLYDNDDPLTDQPAQTAYNTTGIQFNAPESSGTYKVEATLRTGATANAGTVISTTKASFIVAGNHTVTLKYMSGSYTIQPSTTIGGTPLDWTEITAPTLVGYTFANWTLGEGITIDTSDGKSVNDATIYFKASYDGTLTANYTKKDMIYFYNTLGWSDVWVYFYTSDKYWADGYGTGAWKQQSFNYSKPYWDMRRGHMTRIEGTNIWYFDYQAAGYGAYTSGKFGNVAFTNMGDQSGSGAGDDTQAPDNDKAYFSNTTAEPIQVVRRGDHKSELPMFVPLIGQTPEKKNNNKAEYASGGYWMNYPDNTGYTLRIYNWYEGEDPAREIPFPFGVDQKMPLKLDVEFNEDGRTRYWFDIYRNDGIAYGVNAQMKQDSHSEYRINGGSDKIELIRSALGIYTFTLSYYYDEEVNPSDSKPYGNMYHISVDFPVEVGDFRIVYKDNAKWSQASAHGALWYHPSDIINKIATGAEEPKKDIVSMYIAQGAGITPSMKFQYVSDITTDGESHTSTVTWTDVVSGTINLGDFSNDITKAGVYNIYVSQPATGSGIQVDSIKPYKGNYYIRTDCAGSTKWDSYKTNDHTMQFSEYTKENEGFSHFYAHWVNRSTNIKFCIANDYSTCVSDTLTKDIDIDFKNMDDGGTLKTDNNAEAYKDRYSANIRFMYDEDNNKLSRAYLASSTDISKKFLVMKGNSASGVGHIFTSDGKELTAAAGGKHPDLDEYEMNFQDDQNFIYEATIKANPTALIKLYGKYCGRSQEFKGDTTATFSTTDDHAIEILGGTYAAEKKERMRIVYDFKTNRLVCAWLPSGEIDSEININADVMILREGQGRADQISLKDTDSKLGKVKNVFGVMRFNRWTLANKDKSTHDPLPDGSTASIAERRMYFISFPFDVNLGDIFGLGAYDDHWWIQYYDGKARAKECFWAESKGFWKFLENTPGAKLKANEGYILTLGSEMLRSDNTDIWVNNIDQVELFFPSATDVKNIEKTDATVTLDAYTCTETRDSRNIKDSHWHCMGVPSYANYDKNVTDGSSAISWGTERWSALNVPFLYNWNKVDNTLTVHTSNDYDFQAMHAYMVQYHGDVKWSSTSVPKAVAARKRAGYKGSYEFRLELQKDGVMTDQTYVNLTDDEQATKAFDFNLDLSKEGSTRSTICTVTSDAIPVAGNSMPLETESTTVVPVSVSIKADGEYTFAMPDGTEGMVVTLVDNETNMHTNLALGTYTLELTAGTYEGRFALEIDPRNAPTTIDIIGGEGEDAAPRKVFINGLMYILRGDKVYDANGRVVQ